MESRIRNNRDETAHVFDAKGNIVKTFVGKGAEVKIDTKGLPENTIITHNHPLSIGEKGIMRIGNSFSGMDIISAIRANAKEIRAITPTYTFSLKRPKGGWGITAKQAVNSYNQIYDKIYWDMYKYVRKRNFSDTANDRARVTTHHDVVKELAKKYGWNYSKKKG